MYPHNATKQNAKARRCTFVADVGARFSCCHSGENILSWLNCMFDAFFFFGCCNAAAREQSQTISVQHDASNSAGTTVRNPGVQNVGTAIPNIGRAGNNQSTSSSGPISGVTISSTMSAAPRKVMFERQNFDSNDGWPTHMWLVVQTQKRKSGNVAVGFVQTEDGSTGEQSLHKAPSKKPRKSAS